MWNKTPYLFFFFKPKSLFLDVYPKDIFRWKNNLMMKGFHYNTFYNIEKLEAT